MQYKSAVSKNKLRPNMISRLIDITVNRAKFRMTNKCIYMMEFDYI